MKKYISLLIIATFSACTTLTNIDVKDYPIVTTIGELAEFYSLNLDMSGKSETTTVTKLIDGSYELKYEYELLETDEFTPLFYSVSISKEKTIKDAKLGYTAALGALRLVGNSFGQGAEKIDSLKIPADDFYYALRTYEGEPNGMFLVLRKGTRVYSMIMSGLYSEDNSLLNDLLIPQISKLDDFNLKKKNN